MGRYTASLRAVAKVFGNPRVRSLQLAGAGSTLGTYAYAVALPIYAYHSGGARTVGLRVLRAVRVRCARGAVAGRPRGPLVAPAAHAERRSRPLRDLRGHDRGSRARAAARTSSTCSRSARRSSPARTSPAQAALMPSLVKTPDELTAANLVGNTVSSVGMFAGPGTRRRAPRIQHPLRRVRPERGGLRLVAFFVVQIHRDDPPEAAGASELGRTDGGIVDGGRRPALRVSSA